MAMGTLSAVRLLWDFLKGNRGTRSGVTESALTHSRKGHPWLLYSPRATARRAIVLIHGVSARASEDVNLAHLARCVASLGHPCLTPPLDGLAHFEHNDADVDIVAEALCRARQMFQAPSSVLAFSYGASYALSAAARPECHDACKIIVGFGAYHQLEAALEHQRQLLVDNPRLDQDDSDLLYLRYTLLACQREQLDLTPGAWAAIDGALMDFMSPAPLLDKQRPLLEYANQFDYADLMAKYQRLALSPALSPAGRLNQVGCPVALLHDPRDRFIPPDQVQLLRRELDARVGIPRTRILVTPMLSHVRVDPMRNLRDTWHLIRLLRPVFE